MPAETEISKQRHILFSFLFVLPFTLLVLLTILLFALSSALKTSNRWVQHTLEVKNAISNLSNHLLEAESATRGFLLTRDASFLDDEEVATRANADLQRIQRLTEDNLAQQQSITTVEPLIQAKLDLLAQVIILQKQNEAERVRQTIDKGRQKMDAIRPIITAMKKEEDRLLDLRQTLAARDGRFTRWLAVSLLVVDLFALVTIAHLLRRAKRLQQLVTVCAWTKTIQHQGCWLSFEEYLKQRFGLSVTHSISHSAYEKLRTDVDAQTAQAA